MNAMMNAVRHRKPRRRFAAVILAATSAALLSVAVTPAAAQELATASCPAPYTDPETVGRTAPGQGTEVAHVFVAQESGNPTRVELFLLRNEPSAAGDFVVQIVSVVGGEPTDFVLAQGSIAYNSVPDLNSPAPSSVALTAFHQVTPGEEYAVKVFRNAPVEGSVGTSQRDPCVPGQLFRRADPDNPWVAAGPNDMIFTLFVTPPEGPAEGKTDGTLTIDANKGKVEKGRKVTLNGQYDTPSNESCEPGRTVEIQRKKKGAPDSAFTTFATLQTDNAGNYEIRKRVRKTRVYRAFVQETGACDDELSNTQKVRVQKPRPAQEA